MIIKSSFHSISKFVAMVALALTFFAAQSVTSSTSATAAVVSSISVQGAQRMERDTVIGFITIRPGRSFSTIDIDDSLKALYATGLFSDVQIFQSGRRLVVRVEENPTISNVIVRGNKKIKTRQLKSSLQSSSVGVLSDAIIESDRGRIEEQYRRIGREDVSVDVRTVPLSNNRVNVVFEIAEGGRTRISKVLFVGNNAFGDRRLRQVIETRQSGLLSFLRRDDTYDPDRLRADEELLARFYFDRGYADFEVVSAVADLDEANNEYTITVTVNEGERYKFGSVEIDSTIDGINADNLKRSIRSREGRTYSAETVEKTIENLNTKVATQGFAFSQITPRGERNYEDRTIDVVYIIDEGPRAYVERINISGNDRTRDYVIRREFDIAEGDAYNQVLVDAAKRRLEALGFFESVQVNTSQGSGSDQVIIDVQVKDKSTGAFSFGVGYGTIDGVAGTVSLTERNFLGRGQFLKVSANVGRNNRDYEFAFTEPYFLGRRIAAGFEVYNRTKTTTTTRPFNSSSQGGVVSFGLPVTQTLSTTVFYAFDRTRITNSTQPTLYQNANTVKSSAGYVVAFNNLDNPANPRNGFFAELRQEFAGLGGSVRFLQTTARASAYKTILEGEDIVAVANLKAGDVRGLGRRLRYVDHFQLGPDIIRGFAYNGFGPRTAAGIHVGTNRYAAASGEIQFPVPGLAEALGVRGALFADAAFVGSATTTLNDGTAAGLVGTNSIRASVGVSILWDSPLGPLRGDFTKVLKRAPTDRTQIFNFGISTRF